MTYKSINFFLFLIFLLTSFLASAQDSVKFEQGIYWEQIVSQAKQEHKYIFVDCYATWCGPCKAMDQNVYSLKKVGDAVNNKFIAFKVQMDRTAFDSREIKNSYGTADYLAKDYAVNMYPTFLFFDPDGKPIHKVVGYREPEAFMQVLTDAQNPHKQYYRLLKNFHSGKIDTGELKGLARALSYTDRNLAGKLALDYLQRIPKAKLTNPDNMKLMLEFRYMPDVMRMAIAFVGEFDKQAYENKANLMFITRLRPDSTVKKIAVNHILHLSDSDFWKGQNLDFMSAYSNDQAVRNFVKYHINKRTLEEFLSEERIMFLANFTEKPVDRGFDIFYHYTREIDTVMKDPSFAQDVAQWVINKIEVDSLMSAAKASDKEPNLDVVAARIAQKYGVYYAQRIFINAKVSWYLYQAKTKKTERNRYIPNLITYRIQQIEKNGYDMDRSRASFINDLCWNEICLSSNDTVALQTAIVWMGEIVSRDPKRTEYIDTYAGLLYKVGNVEEAIRNEEKAFQLESASDPQSRLAILYRSNLDGMKRGEKVWLSQLNLKDRAAYFGDK